jgi:hypothetical protein
MLQSFSSIFPGDDEAFTRQVTDQVRPPPPRPPPSSPLPLSPPFPPFPTLGPKAGPGRRLGSAQRGRRAAVGGQVTRKAREFVERAVQDALSFGSGGGSQSQQGQGGARGLDMQQFQQWCRPAPLTLPLALALTRRRAGARCGRGDGMARFLEDVGARWLDSVDEDFDDAVRWQSLAPPCSLHTAC